MKFCKYCERILIIGKTKSGRPVFICPECNRAFKAEGNLGLNTKEKVEAKEETGSSVAKKEKKKDSVNFICRKCGNKTYEIIDLGIMYGDEDWVYLMECDKCGTSERVGEGD